MINSSQKATFLEWTLQYLPTESSVTLKANCVTRSICVAANGKQVWSRKRARTVKIPRTDEIRSPDAILREKPPDCNSLSFLPVQVLLRRGHDQQGAGQALRLQVCVRPEDSDRLQRRRAQQPGDRVRAEEAGAHADARPGPEHHHGDPGRQRAGQRQLKGRDIATPRHACPQNFLRPTTTKKKSKAGVRSERITDLLLSFTGQLPRRQIVIICFCFYFLKLFFKVNQEKRRVQAEWSSCVHDGMLVCVSESPVLRAFCVLLFLVRSLAEFPLYIPVLHVF